MNMFTIGKVAQRALISRDTIRLYEREGLIDKPKRLSNGYRTYSEDVIARIRFIKSAKTMGFTLHEIKELLALRRTSKNTCNDIKRQAEMKLNDVVLKIKELQKLKKALNAMIFTCEKISKENECSIIQFFEGGGDYE
ncbi:MAG: heavy metal-responsive transcriptional regulator [Gammaproteobacteria bacterium CG_4_10_14_0_8_um_filter_38_16]|nr:MAG: heavy metal-responsive transcriptional regulator [Gammaproteobacteria bacterium CG_4_10_14_0_8_um_filter_38_16]PJA03413.1 MAG: heavy metal-responsive transcriptional regulator [Gammaproteobacteria bacterium CG_4_10_14_0_2_um_filter_38_22]PJB09886.1 MAG: heavy metal-responsive transcriptional regulator [Gammaproteobacteria bacterium CG_4_9_14_3_um_filter_38_9]